jgi:hypothetical protein
MASTQGFVHFIDLRRLLVVIFLENQGKDLP